MPNDYEAKRQERLRQNAAKLAELQVMTTPVWTCLLPGLTPFHNNSTISSDLATTATVQVASAATQAQHTANEAEQRRSAEQQAARDRLTAGAGAGPRRASNRAAAARTASKLTKQARSGGGDASSSDGGDSDQEQPGPQRGQTAAEEYDPLGVLWQAFPTGGCVECAAAMRTSICVYWHILMKCM